MALLHWKREGKGFRSGLGSRVGCDKLVFIRGFTVLRVQPTFQPPGQLRPVGMLQRIPCRKSPKNDHHLCHTS